MPDLEQLRAYAAAKRRRMLAQTQARARIAATLVPPPRPATR
jgi:hypothetical protein